MGVVGVLIDYNPHRLQWSGKGKFLKKKCKERLEKEEDKWRKRRIWDVEKCQETYHIITKVLYHSSIYF